MGPSQALPAPPPAQPQSEASRLPLPSRPGLAGLGRKEGAVWVPGAEEAGQALAAR